MFSQLTHAWMVKFSPLLVEIWRCCPLRIDNAHSKYKAISCLFLNWKAIFKLKKTVWLQNLARVFTLFAQVLFGFYGVGLANNVELYTKLYFIWTRQMNTSVRFDFYIIFLVKNKNCRSSFCITMASLYHRVRLAQNCQFHGARPNPISTVKRATWLRLSGPVSTSCNVLRDRTSIMIDFLRETSWRDWKKWMPNSTPN